MSAGQDRTFYDLHGYCSFMYSNAGQPDKVSSAIIRAIGKDSAKQLNAI